MVKGSDRIVQCSIVLKVRKGACERLCTALHWQREWAEEVNLRRYSGWNDNDFIKLYIVFDYRTHMSGSCLSLGLFLVVLCV